MQNSNFLSAQFRKGGRGERWEKGQQAEWIQKIRDPESSSTGNRPKPDLSFYFDWLNDYREPAERDGENVYDNFEVKDLLQIYKKINTEIKTKKQAELRESVLDELKTISQKPTGQPPTFQPPILQIQPQPPTLQLPISQSPTAQPSTLQLPISQSPTAQPSTAQPSTAQPSIPQPSTPQPSTPQPSTPQPSTPQPSTSQSSTPQPSTRQSSTRQPPTLQLSTPQPPTLQPPTPQLPPAQSSTTQLQSSAAQSPTTTPPKYNISQRDVNEVVELIVKLSYLIDIKICDNAREATRMRRAPFLPQQSLWESLCNALPKPISDQLDYHELPPPWPEFPQWFNVIKWEKATGLTIQWTHYLNQHLVIDNGTLYLFGNVGILEEFKASKAHAELFSNDFIQETIDSVRLFFPEKPMGYYAKWFRSHGGDKDWQRAIVRGSKDTSRMVSDYFIWRRQLLSVARASKIEGRFSLRRLYHDKRDETMWWTKWGLIIAVFLTISFGLTQSITGIIQVVYAAKGS